MTPHQLLLASGVYGLNDQYWTSVVLYLPLDGSNGSSTITDISPSPRTCDIQGSGIAISTAQSKFGGASLGANISTSNDYARALHNPILSLPGDFCIRTHCWWNAVNTTNFSPTFVAKRDAVTNLEYQFSYFNGNLYFGYSTDGTTMNYVTAAFTPSTGQFYHLEVDRSGSNLYFFVDGTQAGTTQTVSGTGFGGTHDLTLIGDTVNTHLFNGYLDILQITKGVARNTSNFTPPAAAYPTF